MEEISFIPPNERLRFGGDRRVKRKRVEPEPGFPKHCDLCKVVCRRKIEYEDHLKGKRHGKKLRKKEFIEFLEKKRQAPEENGNISLTNEHLAISPTTSRRMCTVCDLELSSIFVEEDHFKGKRHRQNLKKLSLRVNLGTNPSKAEYQVRGNAPTGEQQEVAIQAEPATKNPSREPRTASRIAPNPVLGEVEAYIILEKQAEEAYGEYEKVATSVPTEQAQALYLKYQALYKAYETAYLEHVESDPAEFTNG